MVVWNCASWQLAQIGTIFAGVVAPLGWASAGSASTNAANTAVSRHAAKRVLDRIDHLYRLFDAGFD
jgi:hypothetical protein